MQRGSEPRVGGVVVPVGVGMSMPFPPPRKQFLAHFVLKLES